MSSQQMFMQNRRAAVIDNVGFTKLAGNLFPQRVEGEMLPDLCYFGYADHLSTPTTHCNGCANLTEIGRDAGEVKHTCDDLHLILHIFYYSVAVFSALNVLNLKKHCIM